MFNLKSVAGAVLSAAAMYASFIENPGAPRYLRLGRGTTNYHKGGSKWSGADVRAMNARNGVGSSKRRVAHAL